MFIEYLTIYLNSTFISDLRILCCLQGFVRESILIEYYASRWAFFFCQRLVILNLSSDVGLLIEYASCDILKVIDLNILQLVVSCARL